MPKPNGKASSVAITSYLVRALHWAVLGLELTEVEFAAIFDFYCDGSFNEGITCFFQSIKPRCRCMI